MPAYHVDASILINASASDVHAKLHDFKEWPAWSPWLYMEPGAKLDYRGNAGQIGHGFDWEGDLTGAGGMSMTQIEPTELKMDLQFLKPFKSTAKVRFELQEQAPNQTKVTWHMDSSLPFFMFFMTGMVKSMITMDYKRGLRLLKDYVENGKICTSTVVDGLVDISQGLYLGSSDSSSMDDLGDSMSQTIPAVFTAAEKLELEATGPLRCYYPKFNIKQQSCAYTVALPIADAKDVEPPLHIGETVACKALKVTHTGAYEHLGCAWATAIGHQRHRKLKPSKVQAPFELYLSDPETTPTEALVTEVYVPIR